MILLQTERTQGMWSRRVKGQQEGEKERERKMKRYIKLSRLYEAGIEMNMPRRARSLSYSPFSTSGYISRYHKACRITRIRDRYARRIWCHARCTHDTRGFGHARSIDLNLTQSHAFHISMPLTLRSLWNERWWFLEKARHGDKVIAVNVLFFLMH